MPHAARALWANQPLGEVVAREPFGNLEKIADGVWAMISTPLNGDRTTLSNGGIIAGRNAVLAIEGFNQPAGRSGSPAKRASSPAAGPRTGAHALPLRSRERRERISQAARTIPVIRSTERTRDVVERNLQPPDPAHASRVKEAVLLSPASATTSISAANRCA